MSPPPPANAAARRAPSRPVPRPDARPSRPPLRVVGPVPRRSSSPRRAPRARIWISALLVVGSLLTVVVGDALVTEGQVRLSTAQDQLASAVATQKAAQVEVAEKAAPPVVVAQAKAQGLVAPNMVVYLPEVPLDVPLPTPQTAPR
jgi:hypothetical protein